MQSSAEMFPVSRFRNGHVSTIVWRCVERKYGSTYMVDSERVKCHRNMYHGCVCMYVCVYACVCMYVVCPYVCE